MPDWDIQKTESIQTVLDSFHSVWERVEGTQASVLPPQSDASAEKRPDGVPEEWICRQIDMEAETAMFDRALASRCRGAARTTLLEHAAQATHRESFLRGEVFIRSGERHRPRESCPRLGDTLTALREGMLRDMASAKVYRNAAEKTKCEDLQCALERFACEAESAANDKRRTILRCFR